ncbi:YkgJ family cysteine cluster protein [Desulfonema ishimotonii]|uniref:YkgJ family cysteine cluster protein n=1 Tax=Desulfonema ishimotonii TaxID=45657 RepID=A0A401FZJ3_9BACT|nr:YkgJ family cysteine cluster protein [Desulfonema ishimotonii]GBC62367.1 YkgJ family cysteine cluster protein [Desulfonema ishimotonii]
MKKIDLNQIDTLPGKRLHKGDTFSFRCYPGITCFNRCCRNLNLFLYPYDVIRLKDCLGITSARFLDHYVDVVLRPGSYFPEVLLRMADNAEKTCPFLTETGCSVYPDRPDTCRTFPVEHGLAYDDRGRAEQVHFFRPPDFCLGQHETQAWTTDTWADDQEAKRYNRMTTEWAGVRGLFQNNPWGAEGPEGPKAKMAFMAAYNMDQFKDFVFNSSFLRRYKVRKELQRKCRRSDAELLKLGYDWIRFCLWGMKPTLFRIR